MATPRILTAYDAIEFATRLMEGQGVSANQQSMRWALNNAYMELGMEFDWAFLQSYHRIITQPAQTQGTVAYDHEGGTYDRMLTLTGATWPSWTEDGVVVVSGIPCAVEARINSAIITLDPSENPGSDIASGTSYTLYRNCYPLPNDCRKIIAPRTENHRLSQVDAATLHEMESRQKEVGEPLYYAVRGIDDLYGQPGIYFYPAPDARYVIDFMYHRHPRQIRYTGWDQNDYAGTVSATAGTKIVTGSGTAWSKNMVGSIIRFGGTSTPPTGLAGASPWVEERSILDVTSPSSLTVDADIENTYANVKYRITDPVDMDQSLHQAFLWCIAYNLGVERNYIGLPSIEAKYRRALESAKANNRKVGGLNVAGIGCFTDVYEARYVVPPSIVDEW